MIWRVSHDYLNTSSAINLELRSVSFHDEYVHLFFTLNTKNMSHTSGKN